MTLRLSTLLYSAFLGKGWGDMTVFSMVLMGIEQLWSKSFFDFPDFALLVGNSRVLLGPSKSVLVGISGLLAPSAPSLGYMNKKKKNADNLPCVIL